MKKLLHIIITTVLLVSVSACAKTETPTPTNTPTPEPTVIPTPEPTEVPTQEPVGTIEFTVEGFYTMFGANQGDKFMTAQDLEMASEITLNEDGTGSATFEGDTMDITKWELNGDVISIVMLDGGTADAKVHDGILELDVNGDGGMIIYYAQEGADISNYVN